MVERRQGGGLLICKVVEEDVPAVVRMCYRSITSTATAWVDETVDDVTSTAGELLTRGHGD